MPELKARASLDSTQYNGGVEAMKGKAGGLSSAFGKVGTALAGWAAGYLAIKKIGEAIGEAIRYAGDLNDKAAQYGTDAESYGRAVAVVGDLGGKQEQLDAALSKVKDSQGEVARGTESATKALKELGINQDAFLRMDSAEALAEIGRALESSGDSAAAYSAAIDLVGENAVKLGPALKEMGRGGGEGFSVLSNEAAKTLDALGTKIDQIKLRIKNAGTEMLAGFVSIIPGMKEAAEKALEEDEKARAIAAEATVEAAAKARGEKVQTEIDALTKKAETQADKIAAKAEKAGGKINAGDSMVGIGASFGSSVSPMLSLMEEQLKVQQETKALDAELLAINREIADKMAEQRTVMLA